MEKDSRSRRQKLKDDFDEELQRRQEIRHKFVVVPIKWN